MSTGDASLVWAAYAAGIAALSGISSLTLGPNQVFAIAPQNTFSIPIVPYVNQYYQNWAIYEFASVVPEPGVAVFTPSGQPYDEAYQNYLDNVYFAIPNDPRIEASINTTSARLASLRTEVQGLLQQALASFRIDCPNGVSLFTGLPTTLAEYLSFFYPEIADDISALSQVEAVRYELLRENIGGAQLATLNAWRDALAKGNDSSNSHPNYNFPVLQVDSPTIVDVTNGSIPGNTGATSYEAAYTIGGNFNSVAQQWINTFPSSYPGSTTAYDAGASTYSSNNLTVSNNNWSQYGYGSATQYTGSSGWIFWSSYHATTNTWSNSVVSIDETSFSSGIKVSAWGVGQFPVNRGSWYQGNPLVTWPDLLASAKPGLKDYVSQQITSVVLGYGIQISFTLTESAYRSFSEAVSSAQSSSGGLSIFGFLYGNGQSDYTSSYNAWSYLDINESTRTVVLKAQHLKIPQVLGTIITKISS